MIDPRYCSALILFTVSFVGCSLPFYTTLNVANIRPFATGVILSVALCHCLPDAEEKLNTAEVAAAFTTAFSIPRSDPDDLIPFASVFLLLGFLSMLTIDQFIQSHHDSNFVKIADAEVKKIAEEGDHRDHSHSHDHEEARLLYQSECGHEPLALKENCAHRYDAVEDGGARGYEGSADLKSRKALKVYSMEGAIAVHSFVIGVTLGVRKNVEDKSEMSALAALTFALCFHQIFEGIALGVVAFEGNLSRFALAILVAILSSSLPMGILLGIVASGREGDADKEGVGGRLQLGIPSAVTAGMLLQIAFEFLNHDICAHLNDNCTPVQTRSKKLVCLFAGAFSMSILSIWT